MKSVECEFVEYRTDDMVHATTRLIHNFASYSGIAGTAAWLAMVGELSTLIKDQHPFICDWKTEALDIRFSGFLEPIPTIRHGRVVFSSREPRFVFEDKHDWQIRPSVRTHVQRVTEAIAKEMKEVYRLRIDGQSPLTLVFPNKEYAKGISVYAAMMFDR